MDKSNELNRLDITIDISKEFLKELRGGDVDHGLSVAEMLLSEGPNFNPELLIVLIESIIELSVQAGSQEAREYLDEKWSTLKRAHLRRLLSK